MFLSLLRRWESRKPVQSDDLLVAKYPKKLTDREKKMRNQETVCVLEPSLPVSVAGFHSYKNQVSTYF